MNNLISVIIPVYNASAYIRQAVESALAQPETGEVIMVEDGSKDDSREICKQLSTEYKNVHFFMHPNGINQGAGASRNLGILNASHDFIAFLDADDFYLPLRFKTSYPLLVSHPTIDGVYEATGTYIQDHAMISHWKKRCRGKIETVGARVRPETLFDHMLRNNRWFHTSGILVRKSIFDKTGLFDTNLLLHQDSAMWIKMSSIGRLVGGEIDKPVSMRRVHQSNRYINASNKDLAASRYHLWKTLWSWRNKGCWNRNQRGIVLYMYLLSIYNYYKNLPGIGKRFKAILMLAIVAFQHPLTPWMGPIARSSIFYLAKQINIFTPRDAK